MKTDLFIKIKADNTDANAKLDSTTAKVDKLKTKSDSVGNTTKLSGLNKAYMGLAAGLAAVSVVAIDCFKSYTLSLNALIKLTNAMSGAGSDSSVFTDQLVKQALALQKLTIYEDDAIISGTALAQSINTKLDVSQLLNVQKVAIGLAATYGIDLLDAFKKVALASAGNTKALARYIPLVKNATSGVDALNIALLTNDKRFKNATDQANTAAGRIKQVANLWGNAKLIVGQTVSNMVLAFDDIAKGTGTASSALLLLANIVSGVIGGITLTLTGIGTLIATVMVSLATIAKGIYDQIQNVFNLIVDAAFDTAKGIVKILNPANLIKGIKLAVTGKNFKDAYGKLFDYSETVASWKDFGKDFNTTISNMVSTINTAANTISNPWNKITGTPKISAAGTEKPSEDEDNTGTSNNTGAKIKQTTNQIADLIITTRLLKELDPWSELVPDDSMLVKMQNLGISADDLYVLITKVNGISSKYKNTVNTVNKLIEDLTKSYNELLEVYDTSKSLLDQKIQSYNDMTDALKANNVLLANSIAAAQAQLMIDGDLISQKRLFIEQRKQDLKVAKDEVEAARIRLDIVRAEASLTLNIFNARLKNASLKGTSEIPILQEQLSLYQTQLSTMNDTNSVRSERLELLNKILGIEKEISKIKEPGSIKIMKSGVELLAGSVNSLVGSLANGLGNAFAGMLTKTKGWKDQMSQMWKDLGKTIISTISSIIIKMLAMLAIQTALNFISPGLGTLVTSGGSIFGGKSTNNNGNSAIDNSIPYRSSTLGYRSNSIIHYLKKIDKSLSEFEPVQTQVIDLPTLSNAARLGNAMTLRIN